MQLVSIIWSHSSRSASWAGPSPRARPALFTSTSTAANSGGSKATAANTASRSLTSSATVRALGPSSLARSSSRSTRRAAAMTRAPAAANLRAVGGPEAAARAGDEDGGGLGACHDYSMVVSCAPGTARWSALRRPEWRSSRPLSAWTRRPASAVIACVPGPARPVPSGDAAVQAVPAAARAASVQITTSWLPGVPYVPVAVKPPPAAASAVTPWPRLSARRAAPAARPRPGGPAVGGDGRERDALAGRGDLGACRGDHGPVGRHVLKLRAGRPGGQRHRDN